MEVRGGPFVLLGIRIFLESHLEGSPLPAVLACFQDTLCEMGAVAGGCERILSTPMPLSYTRFTGRALMIWLMALPLALCPLLGWATVPVIFAAAYLLIGIDECGVEIEEPFCILPLQARPMGACNGQTAVLITTPIVSSALDTRPTFE